MPEAVVQKGKQTKQMLVSELDLTKMDGNGDFPCPTCGVTISPEDETEDVYTIIEEKVRNDAFGRTGDSMQRVWKPITYNRFSFP